MSFSRAQQKQRLKKTIEALSYIAVNKSFILLRKKIVPQEDDWGTIFRQNLDLSRFFAILLQLELKKLVQQWKKKSYNNSGRR